MVRKDFDRKKANQKLLERTLEFAKKILRLVQRFPKDSLNKPLIVQLIRSGTSVGANYREACEAESAKDFVHKIKIAKKESRETEYWLKLLLELNPDLKKEINALRKEAMEFTKIFATIVSRFK